MVAETTKARSPLLPDRYAQEDFFVCDIFDATPKGDMGSMEHPIFSLSTKPDRHVRRYEHNDNWVEILPSAYGLATVYDRDILIYCISQLVAALNKGKPVSQVMRFKAYDLLTATNRPMGGESYTRLKDALERIVGTRITTNIITSDKEIARGFGLIENYEIVRKTRDGRMQEVQIKLSDWVFNAIEASEVLTLHRDYFRLRKPIERRIYEIARKHCGSQPHWHILLANLQKKCGSTTTPKEFKRLISKVVKDNAINHHIPDYRITLDHHTVCFTNRNTMPESPQMPQAGEGLILSQDIHERAKQLAPSYDTHWLEREWRDFWYDTGKPDIQNPDAAFLAFCKKRYFRNPQP